MYMYGCNVYWWGTNATTCCITTCPPARPVGPQTRDVTAEERVRRNTHTHARANRFTNTHTHTHTHTFTLSNTHTHTHRLTDEHTDLQTHTRARARAHMHIHAHAGSLARGVVIYYATVRRARVPSSPSPSSPSCGRVESRVRRPANY